LGEAKETDAGKPYVLVVQNKIKAFGMAGRELG